MMNEQDNRLPLYRQLAAARRAQGISQGTLARQVGCAQAAISMMENGKPDAIARETVLKIASVLKVDVADDAGSVIEPASASTAVCPNGDCPSNVPFAVNGQVAFLPRKQPVASARFCAFCGEVLEHACSNCGAPIGEGAFCQRCGTPYVMAPAADIGDAAEWAAKRRREIAELKSLV